MDARNLGLQEHNPNDVHGCTNIGVAGSKTPMKKTGHLAMPGS